MRPLAFAAALGLVALSNASADDAKPEPNTKAAFDAYVAEANASYATERLAILKLDDVLYLKPGQSAALNPAPEGSGKAVVFAMGERQGATILMIAYDGEAATLSGAGADERIALDGTKTFSVSPAVDLRLQKVEIAPGEEGLRVGAYNQDQRAAKDFAGLDFYPFDPGFVVKAQVVPRPEVAPVTFQTSRGWYKRFYPLADAVFTLEGREMKLPLYASEPNASKVSGFSSFFMDETTGRTTYGSGRYIDFGFEPGQIPGSLTINFNEAYNPLCARSPHWNCPVAIDVLPIAIEAGEKAPSKEDHAAAN